MSFFDPKELGREMGAMGFASIENLGAKEINSRYFLDRTDSLGVSELARLMCAHGK